MFGVKGILWTGDVDVFVSILSEGSKNGLSLFDAVGADMIRTVNPLEATPSRLGALTVAPSLCLSSTGSALESRFASHGLNVADAG